MLLTCCDVVATKPQEHESTDCAVVCVLCRWADSPTHRQVLQRGRGQSMNVKLQHLANQEASFLSETERASNSDHVCSSVLRQGQRHLVQPISCSGKCAFEFHVVRGPHSCSRISRLRFVHVHAQVTAHYCFWVLVVLF